MSVYKLKNKAVIYWEQPGDTPIFVKEIKELPKSVKILIVNSILQDLNIGVSIR